MAEAKVPWITGFCGTGSHEGMRPKSFSGKPLKTCPGVFDFGTCGCKCHADLDKLFEMSGMARVIQENPEYIPEHVVVIMPTVEERAARFSKRDAVPAVVLESPLPGRVPATIERSFAPTTSGRAARGELELWVKKICDAWILEQPEDMCSPQYISDRIASERNIKAPSVGAINAVFERWVKIDYALVARRPVRFIGYTPAGVEHGLEGLKEKARRAK